MGSLDNIPDEDKIDVRNVGRVYRVKRGGTKAIDFQAIKDVSLKVKQGEFLSIVGPSGCGKSTLLDMLAGLAPVNSGEIFIDGKRMTGPDLDRGIILQGYALFPWRSVRQNVELGLEIKGVPKKEEEPSVINISIWWVCKGLVTAFHTSCQAV